jgi:hypothetical protein
VYKHSVHQPGRVAALLWAGAFLSASGTALGKECWLDVYDKANYEGNRVRINGPAELPDLKSLNKEDWSNRIESLQVGADAEVIAFRKPNFEEEPEGQVYHPEAFQSWGKKEIPAYQELEISFGPGKKEHHLGELNFHKNINSLKVRCRK